LAAPSFCGADMPTPHKKSLPKSLTLIILSFEEDECAKLKIYYVRENHLQFGNKKITPA
jgi:hypothetical protein